MSAKTADVVVSDIDPFDEDVLALPHSAHEQLRRLAPAVWLARYGVWGVAGHAHVHAALNDPATFCSSAGVGLADFRKERPLRTPSLLLEADPPEHTRARHVVTRVLSPATVRSLRAAFQAAAAELFDGLRSRAVVDVELVEDGHVELVEDQRLGQVPGQFGVSGHRGYRARPESLVGGRVGLGAADGEGRDQVQGELGGVVVVDQDHHIGPLASDPVPGPGEPVEQRFPVVGGGLVVVDRGADGRHVAGRDTGGDAGHLSGLPGSSAVPRATGHRRASSRCSPPRWRRS